jgi:hypothetical protein
VKRIGIVQRIAAVLFLSLFVVSGAIAPSLATAQDATPAAAGLPEGPLGEQMQWLVDYINMPAADAASVDLTTIFTPGVLADVPADQLAAIIGRLRDQLAPVTIDTASIVTTRDLPPSNANFILVGSDGTQQPVSLTVAPDTGLISSIWFSAQLPPAPTAVATATEAPTETATSAPTETATSVPTETLTTVPTETATELPTETPTPQPTETATELPTETPTAVPTETPTEVPTETPTSIPTDTPTEVPTETLTPVPTETATEVPTETATAVPTETPTEVPTETPTPAPTETETAVPTDTPTDVPTETATSVPTETPTDIPTETATSVPTETPTPIPTETATDVPTRTPTEVPTETETSVPTETETAVPTETETAVPTETATVAPTETATELPTETATAVPTEEATEPASPAAIEETVELGSPIASPVIGSPVASAEAGSPVASPGASPFPDTAIGHQAAWTWESLNTNGEAVEASEIEAHIDPALLEETTAEDISNGLVELQEQYGPLTLDPDSIVFTEDEPSTNLWYEFTGQDGTEFVVSLSIDPESELLTSYQISSTTEDASPEASPSP